MLEILLKNLDQKCRNVILLLTAPSAKVAFVMYRKIATQLNKVK